MKTDPKNMNTYSEGLTTRIQRATRFRNDPRRNWKCHWLYETWKKGRTRGFPIDLYKKM